MSIYEDEYKILARKIAFENGNDPVAPQHLLAAMLEYDNTLTEILARDGKNVGVLLEALKRAFVAARAAATSDEAVSAPLAPDQIKFSSAFRDLVEIARTESRDQRKTGEPCGVDFLSAFFSQSEQSYCAQLLIHNGLDRVLCYRMLDDYNEAFRSVKPKPEAQHKIAKKKDNAATQNGSVTANGYKSLSTTAAPALCQFGTDITLMAAQGRIDPMTEQDHELAQIMKTLIRKTKRNPLIIGEAGVGKTALVEGLAQKIIRRDDDLPEKLRGKRIISLDMGAVVAGTKYRGEFEQRMINIVAELKKHKDVIIFLDELHTIVGAGSAVGTMDASNILKPALARGEIQAIGATTETESQKYIEKDKALARRFRKVIRKAPSVSAAKLILRNLKEKLEDHHGIKISNEALDAAVERSDRHIHDRHLPDKAIDLIDEACSSVVMRNQTDPVLTADDIDATLADMLGIPVGKVSSSDKEKMKSLVTELKSSVFGQDEAVSVVAKAVRRGRLDLDGSKRPIGSFVFLGPTGVGKTELTKVLNQCLMVSEDDRICIDMSEYKTKESVSRLIGADPGFIGHEQGGQLTEAVRKRPYSVIVFDEIEKAHKDVQDILLQILEEGHLTDGQGRKVRFDNTIVVITGNIGSRHLVSPDFSSIGMSSSTQVKQRAHDAVKEAVMEDMEQFFKPELLGRIDDVIIFNRLDAHAARQLVDKQLAPLVQNLEKHKVNITFTEAAKEYLANKGCNDKKGGRMMRGLVRTEISDRITDEIYEGALQDGGTALVDCPAVEKGKKKSLSFTFESVAAIVARNSFDATVSRKKKQVSAPPALVAA